METIQEILRESVSGGFWHFIGYWIILGMILGTVIIAPIRLVMIIINRPLRHMNIRKHGYPPAHCDADGDFKKESD